MRIRLATENDLSCFFNYLADHLSDNWNDERELFLPMSKVESQLDEALKIRFSIGVKAKVGESNWRRLLIALDEKENIIGHIDIRSHPENHTSHRAILGMGVERSYRKKGLGEKLINELISWMTQNTTFEYLDLRVLSNNQAAINLYNRTGFKNQGEINDMFRIDGRSLSFTLMSKKVAQ